MHKFLNGLKRELCLLLCVASVLSMLYTAFDFGYAAKTSSTQAISGSNLALGSPLLESNFVSDDWNKWETVLWGVYLSNYITPFVDDYETAFTANGSGSEGSGLKALEFGTGASAGNSDLIQNLLTRAIDLQKNGYKEIYVTYSLFGDTKFKTSSQYLNNTDSSVEDKSQERKACLKDLFFDTGLKLINGDPNLYSNLTFGSVINGVDPTSSSFLNATSTTEVSFIVNGYNSFVGMNCANLPTFAIKVAESDQIVLNYRDSYDIEIMSASICKALTSEFKDKAATTFNTLMDAPLVLDSFGNICVRYNNRNIVVLQSSASQYITKSPSINLVNSLIFNTSTPSADRDNLIYQGGQSDFQSTGWLDIANKWISKNLFNKNATTYYSGSLAFSNGAPGMTKGGTILFYDSDTIICQKIANGTLGSLGTDANGTPNYQIENSEHILDLFDIDITDKGNKYMFKIEPANVTTDMFDILDDQSSKVNSSESDSSTIRSAVKATVMGSGTICNFSDMSPSKPRLHYLVMAGTTKQKVELFQDSFVLPVQVQSARDGGKFNWAAPIRQLPQFMYKAYKNGTIEKSSWSATKEDVINACQALTSRGSLDATTNLYSGTSPENMETLLADDKAPSQFLKSFYEEFNGTLYNATTDAISKVGKYGLLSIDKCYDLLYADGTGDVKPKFTTNNSSNTNAPFRRVVKCYQTSKELEGVADVLGIREGTDFGVYASMIYLTYIEWYGLKEDSLTGNFVSDFNEKMFPEDMLIDDITDVDPSLPSQEEMQKEIINYTYLTLHPTKGRDYRNEIALSGKADFLYSQYQRIVYGSAQSYNNKVITTRNSTGFLNVDNYSENFLTAPFIENYVKISVFLILFGIIATLVVGTLKREKLSWFLISLVMVVNVVLILPTTGEIVPYAANKSVQNLFKDKMTYWSISEQISANDVEQKALRNGSAATASALNSVSDDESMDWSLIYSVSNNLKSLYLDRYISVKEDTSSKVTSADQSNWDQVQKMQTARWLLPMIMREMAAEENGQVTSKYVYHTLADKYEDISNLYWYYNPAAASYARTINGSDTSVTTRYAMNGATDNKTTFALRQNLWSGATDVSISDPADDRLKFKSYAYTQMFETGSSEDYLVHNYSYLLDSNILDSINFDSVTFDSKDNFNKWANKYDEYIQSTIGTSTTIDQVYEAIAKSSSEYNRYDRNSMCDEYGYLWYTEGTLPYFYQVATETFRDSSNVGYVASKLQGRYVGDAHQSFLTDDNGNSRDILDLENLFKNVIPYLYTMQLYTGGYDGTTGHFGNQTIGEDNAVHKNQLKSWLFRSNWASKLMENRELNGIGHINYYDNNGVRQSAKIPCMLMPSAYSNGTYNREMVFSRAQMEQQGLRDLDLSEVELLCVKANDEVYKKWTMLLNYVSAPGMSHEILMRQMAVDGWLTFNDTFSPNALSIGNKSQLYPTSLDLRAISFDSVMTMLMLNVTKNSSYIYGDSMSVIIEDCDILTGGLLLAVAAVCVWIVPLIRNISLGLIFYVGYFIVARAVIGSRDTSKKCSIGYLACNFLYLCLTWAYFLMIRMLMVITKSDQVLKISSMEMNTGSPIWCLLFMLVISIAYIAGSVWLVWKCCIQNYRDLGYTAITGFIETVSNNVSAGFEGLANKLLGDDTSTNGRVGRKRDSGTNQSIGAKGDGTADGSGDDGNKSGSGKGNSGKNKGNNGVSENLNEDDMNGAASGINSRRGGGQDKKDTDKDGSFEIDAAIKQGESSKANYDVSSIKNTKQAEKAITQEESLFSNSMRDYQKRMDEANTWKASADKEGPSGEQYQLKMNNYEKLVKEAENFKFQAEIHKDNKVVIENKMHEFEANKSKKKKSSSESTEDK